MSDVKTSAIASLASAHMTHVPVKIMQNVIVRLLSQEVAVANFGV